MLLMQVFDIFTMSLISVILTLALTAYLFYRRMTSDVKTIIRVHMSGGTEKQFDAIEVDREVKWVQDSEKLNAEIPIDVNPSHIRKWGIAYRVFNVTDGADEVVKVPWLNPNVHADYLGSDDARKERYRKRVRALDTFKQLAAGLASMHWSRILLHLVAGAGLWEILSNFIIGVTG